MSGGRSILLVLVVLAAAVLASGCGGPDGEVSPDVAGGFEYAVPINPYELTESELERALDLAQAAGVNSIVSGASWWYVAPRDSPESYRTEPMDRLVDESRERGLKLTLQVNGSPDRIHPRLEDSVADYNRIWYPPRERDDIREFGDFVGYLVERYGTSVGRYEVWNEPNSVDFWKPEPDPAEYAALLRRSYLSAKQADSRVTVAFGGLSMNDAGYLSQFYEAVRRYPDAPENSYFFDELSVHPYTYGDSPDWEPQDLTVDGANGPLAPHFTGISQVKRVVDLNEEGNKKVFIGEFGYSTERTWMPAVPDRRRALYLKRAYAIAQELPYVSGMSWYSFLPESTVGSEWTILDGDLEPSLTYQALKQVAAPSTASPLPEVTLPRPPAESVSGEYLLDPNLSHVEPSGVSGWELYVDGVPSGFHDEVPFQWDSSRVEDGPHSLMLAMYTRDGSVWPSEPHAIEVRQDEEAPE